MINQFYINIDQETNKYKCEGPLEYFLTENDEALLFHVLNVGQGLMILIIFPDKTTMLFDCFIKIETEEEILQYLTTYIPVRKNDKNEDEQWIDIFVNSHRDKDHYQNLKSVNNKFTIKSIWDSGQYGTGASSGNVYYNYYMYLKRKVKKEYGDSAVPILEPSNLPFRIFGDAKVYCLNSKEDFIENNELELNENLLSFSNYNESFIDNILESSTKYSTKDQHTNCIVLLIDYKGKRLLLTGDSDWKSWKESIVTNFKDYDLLKTDILIASHHGSRSFFTDEKINDEIDIEKNPDTTFIDHISYIQPCITLVSCGEYSTHHHPNEEAMKVYKQYSDNEQVYTTNDKSSGFIGFINSDSYWGVVPSNFYNKKSDSDIEFILECESEKNNRITKVISGQALDLKANLKFKAHSIRGMADSLVKENVKVTWEVSNSGRTDDEKHQEIYYVGKDEKKVMYTSEMKRDLMYDGIHMVRCTIENKDRNKEITKVFKIEGIK